MPISNGNNPPFFLNLYWEENGQPGFELVNHDDQKIFLNNAVEATLNTVVEDYYTTAVVAAMADFTVQEYYNTTEVAEVAEFPVFPVPTFPMGEMASKPASKPAPRYRCPIDECLAQGRGQVVHLYNLTKHFATYHGDIFKGNSLYPCKANELRFFIDQVQVEEVIVKMEGDTTPPLVNMSFGNSTITSPVPTSPPAPRTPSPPCPPSPGAGQ